MYPCSLGLLENPVPVAAGLGSRFPRGCQLRPMGLCSHLLCSPQLQTIFLELAISPEGLGR